MRSRAVPRLLVSVRSASEATEALAGGCDLVDVKEPDRGPLGAADAGVIAEVVAAVRRTAPGTPVSAALGELFDRQDRTPAGLDPDVSFVKLGLSGCRDRPDWNTCWQAARGLWETAGSRGPRWIAVLYADAESRGPDPAAVIESAASATCAGVLVDTFTKDGRGLFDHVTSGRLIEWRAAVERSGLLFAVAGSLRPDDLPRLVPVRPDIVAVRGAACRGGRRNGAVDRDAVREFRSKLRDAFGEHESRP